jgi:hypothetical protein
MDRVLKNKFGYNREDKRVDSRKLQNHIATSCQATNEDRRSGKETARTGAKCVQNFKGNSTWNRGDEKIKIVPNVLRSDDMG